MVTFEAFEQQLKDCLAHYYDYAFLQRHPLVMSLAANASGDALRVKGFREQIEQAIETLKPGPDSDPSSRQSRLYSILYFRYINQQQVQHVLHRLNLGERQFYRDHGKAIQALCDVLWERVKDTPSAPAISIQSEIQRVHRQARPEQIDARLFLQKALTSIQSLVEQYQVEITLQVDDYPLFSSIDSAVLRQAIIWILSRCIIESTPDSRFTLAYLNHGVEGEFTITLEQVSKRCNLAELIEQDTLQKLVQAVEGRLESRPHGGHSQISLYVPLHKHSILIIDDNPDAVALFRNYLTRYPYQVFTAHDGEQALQTAKDCRPDVIVLDVLLPDQDGWEILQSLKSQSATLHIPVLICSVLDSPELARVLGADGFLHKPPTEADFLDVLAQFPHAS
jgi:CheY-like chemotaxis protein